MIDTEAFVEFKKALTLLRNEYPDKALAHIRRAVDLEKHNPYYLSYMGVVLARAEQKWAEAEELCDTALRLKRDQPQLYLNMAEVYAKAGRREDAVETLSRGLRYARRDYRLNQALSKLAIRRPPVLPFLSRGHFLNCTLGKLRHRALMYFAKE